MSPLSLEAERLRREIQVVAGETDRQRWEDASSYEQFWSDRSAAAAKLCNSGQWVCDIGCGMRGLGAMLPTGCTYLPADLRCWEPAVERCDLNAGLLPERHLSRCDVVTLLGVIEYIYDLPCLFAALARRAETVLVSYNCVELAEVDRVGYGWANALTSEAVLNLLRQAGFLPDTVQRFGAMEILVRASNPGFSRLRRLRRRVARLLHARP